MSGEGNAANEGTIAEQLRARANRIEKLATAAQQTTRLLIEQRDELEKEGIIGHKLIPEIPNVSEPRGLRQAAAAWEILSFQAGAAALSAYARKGAISARTTME